MCRHHDHRAYACWKHSLQAVLIPQAACRSPATSSSPQSKPAFHSGNLQHTNRHWACRPSLPEASTAKVSLEYCSTLFSLLCLPHPVISQPLQQCRVEKESNGRDQLLWQLAQHQPKGSCAVYRCHAHRSQQGAKFAFIVFAQILTLRYQQKVRISTQVECIECKS